MSSVTLSVADLERLQSLAYEAGRIHERSGVPFPLSSSAKDSAKDSASPSPSASADTKGQSFEKTCVLLVYPDAYHSVIGYTHYVFGAPKGTPDADVIGASTFESNAWRNAYQTVFDRLVRDTSQKFPGAECTRYCTKPTSPTVWGHCIRTKMGNFIASGASKFEAWLAASKVLTHETQTTSANIEQHIANVRLVHPTVREEISAGMVGIFSPYGFLASHVDRETAWHAAENTVVASLINFVRVKHPRSYLSADSAHQGYYVVTAGGTTLGVGKTTFLTWFDAYTKCKNPPKGTPE